jgi:hypothetical protein
MSVYLIEIPHPAEKIACLHAIQVFLESGSHFLANADWGCLDGEHKAWMVVNVDNKDQALQIVPPLFRNEAKITKLVKYIKDNVEEGFRYHDDNMNNPFNTASPGMAGH